MLGKIARWLQTRKRNRQWRERNAHNTTGLMRETNMDLIQVGRATYGGVDVLNFDSKTRVSIGSYCSIGPDVLFIPSADHYSDRISTFPFIAKCVDVSLCEGVSKGDIIVEDDVWIGTRVTILSGVRIGQGAIIAAGSVVNKDVPPYAIVGGVPAKVLKYRFSPETIQHLMKIDYSQLTEDMIRTHISQLYEPLTSTEQLTWLPKKKD